MDFLATCVSALPVIAAVFIFVVGYFALFLSIMICLLVARLVLEGARVARTRLVTLPLQEAAVSYPSGK
jgi:uncharacterized membrane protein